MRAMRLNAPGGLDKLVLAADAMPEPGAGEILVRIRACSLNYRDIFFVEGTNPSVDGRILLSDGAGEVVAIGPGVDEFAAGDRVVSCFYPHWLRGPIEDALRRGIPGEDTDGYARDYACVPAQFFTKAPAGYTAAEAASLTCTAVTAWRALVVAGRIRPGDTVLVQGTGSVALFALQFAKLAGARVIATSSSDAKLAKLTALGANDVINYRTNADWGAEVRRLTNGRGVDHVIEVGGPETFAQSVNACRIGGHIALIGILSGFAGVVSFPAVFVNQLRVTGIQIGSREDQIDMIRAIEVTGLRPIVDRSFPLERMADAFRYYATGRHFGKICIEL